MATLRPLKEGSVRTYQEKVALGFPDILASEMDADLDTIYAAWNGGVATANLIDGSVTFAKLAPDAQLWRDTGTTLTPGVNYTARTIALTGSFTGGIGFLMGSATVKARLRDVGASGVQILANSNGQTTPDDAAKPGWMLSLNPTSDVFDIYRAPAAASQTFALLSRQDANGLNVTGNLTVGGAGSPRINLGQRCAWESWDGNIATLFVNDSTTIGYSTGLGGWRYQFDYRAGGGAVLAYHGAGGAYGPTMTFDTGGSFTITGSFGVKATGTTWSNPSDRRLKDAIEDYPIGLAAILQLQPRTFVFNGKGGSTAGLRGYGFVADEIASIMPETVGVRAGKLNPDDEDETDIQTLDQSNLILALVNAVKELAARVGTLEGLST